jgi:hypothetical protein
LTSFLFYWDKFFKQKYYLHYVHVSTMNWALFGCISNPLDGFEFEVGKKWDTSFLSGLPYFSWCNTPKREKIYQTAWKYIPNDQKIDQISKKYTCQHLPLQSLQHLPTVECLVWKYYLATPIFVCSRFRTTRRRTHGWTSWCGWRTSSCRTSAFLTPGVPTEIITQNTFTVN